MKYLFYILLVWIAIGCSKKNIAIWEGEHYVYFTEEESKSSSDEISPSDSISVSFFFYLEDEIQYPLEVGLTGQLLEKDTPFKVVVDKEKSNLPENLYSLPNQFIFGKGQVKDTIYIALKNDPILQDKKYDLKLDIVQDGTMLTHKGKNGSRLLKVSDIAEKPSWWLDNPIKYRYLGEYSRKKYELFMKVTGESELNLDDLGKVRRLTLKFQHWLDSQEPKILDEDGNEMTTEIIG